MSASALESRRGAPIAMRQIQCPRRAKTRFGRGFGVWKARRQTFVLRASGIELVLLFENFPDAQHRTRRKLTRGKVRNQPRQLRTRKIVLLVMPVNQRERFQSRRRIRPTRRDLQVFEYRALGTLGLGSERAGPDPDQFR